MNRFISIWGLLSCLLSTFSPLYARWKVDSIPPAQYSEQQYWQQKEELLKEREDLIQEKNNMVLEAVKVEGERLSGWFKAVLSFLTAFSIIVAVFALYINIQNRKLDLQQKLLEEQQKKLDTRQNQMNITLERILATEEDSIATRKKARIYLILNAHKAMPPDLQFVFNGDRKSFPGAGAINKLSSQELAVHTVSENHWDAVVLIDPGEDNRFNEEDVKRFQNLLHPSIAFALFGSQNFNRFRELSSSANVSAQLYQNLMNLLKFQALQRGELIPK